ncbi:NPCBM/NEW2 domain-containing protein [Nocardiopsis sp. frass1]|uniref:NPCBM/NEW2 domain-containing protein n=1 Tax=Nocardiopsis protaetiae TaxID=3382270 RepID=UPI00387A8E87
MTALFALVLGGGLGYFGATMRQEREQGRDQDESSGTTATGTEDGETGRPGDDSSTSEEGGTSPEQGSAEGGEGTAQSRLSQLEVAQSGHHYDTGPATVNGQEYTETVQLRGCANCFVEFDLGRKWTTFEAVVGLSDGSRSDASVTVRVFAGEDLLESHTLGLGESAEISVSVEGALRLRLEAERVKTSG